MTVEPHRVQRLWREAAPMVVCGCAHSEQEHDINRHGERTACSHSACGCKALRPVERRWRVHGWVSEPIEPS